MSEENMREAFKRVKGCEMKDAMACAARDFEDGWKAALKFADTNSESEAGAGAVAEIYVMEDFETGAEVNTIRCLDYKLIENLPHGAKLFLAPQSSQAIETAAYMRAAEVAMKFGCAGRTILDTERAILALIPQDGYTHLQDLMMQGAASAWLEGELCGRGNKPYSADPIVAIVTSLIGEKK